MDIQESEPEKIQLTLFDIDQLNKSLDILRVECIQPIMDNNPDIKHNRELFTYFLFIKECFKTLDILQILIKAENQGSP